MNNEVFRITCPTLSAHNLVFGTPYLDIGEKAVVSRIRDENGEEDVYKMQFIITFTRRGWFNDNDNFKCEGELTLNNQITGLKVTGKWNESLQLI
jgi:hypothetical protein